MTSVPFRQQAVQLLRQLESIFPDSGLNGGISLTQAYLLDDGLIDCDQEGFQEHPLMQKAYAEDATDRWRNVSAKVLKQQVANSMVLSFMDRKAWCYYLPAFIRCALNEWLAGNTEAADDASCVVACSIVTATQNPRKGLDLEVFAPTPQGFVAWLGWTQCARLLAAPGSAAPARPDPARARTRRWRTIRARSIRR